MVENGFEYFLVQYTIRNTINATAITIAINKKMSITILLFYHADRNCLSPKKLLDYKSHRAEENRDNPSQAEKPVEHGACYGQTQKNGFDYNSLGGLAATLFLCAFG